MEVKVVRRLKSDKEQLEVKRPGLAGFQTWLRAFG